MSDIRFYPEMHDSSYYEHMHRYLFAREYVEGKKVLDISCGEGYGSYLLMQKAASVTGCDIDPEIIDHAKQKYGENVNYVVGDCRNMSFDDNSFDVLVSFETIEHIYEQELFLAEAKRVLRPDGIMIVSTPDKAIYTDLRNYHNSDHKKELYKQEFIDLMQKYFKNVATYGERFTRSCFIYATNNKGTYRKVEYGDNQEPMFIIQVCSDNDCIYHPENSFYYDVDSDEEFFKAKESIDILEEQVRKAKIDSDNLIHQVNDAKEHIERKDNELNEAKDVIDNLVCERQTAQQIIDNKDEELTKASDAIRILEHALNEAKAVINEKDEELNKARIVITGKDEELDKARILLKEKDDEIAKSLSVIETKNDEILNAKENIEQKNAEIEAAQKAIDKLADENKIAKEVIDNKEEEIRRAAEAISFYEQQKMSI